MIKSHIIRRKPPMRITTQFADVFAAYPVAGRLPLLVELFTAIEQKGIPMVDLADCLQEALQELTSDVGERV